MASLFDVGSDCNRCIHHGYVHVYYYMHMLSLKLKETLNVCPTCDVDE